MRVCVCEDGWIDVCCVCFVQCMLCSKQIVSHYTLAVLLLLFAFFVAAALFLPIVQSVDRTGKYTMLCVCVNRMHRTVMDCVQSE